jgi:hypothetical protein
MDNIPGKSGKIWTNRKRADLRKETKDKLIVD